MRALILVLIVAVLAIIAAVATGFVNINQIRGAKAPQLSATANGVTAKGGQTPAFDVETGSVKVGTGDSNVAVPKLTLEKGQKTVQLPRIEVRAPDRQGNEAAH
ncbi:MAG: hypothetical protein ABI770_09560 [Sphingomicrobium sp.]